MSKANTEHFLDELKAVLESAEALLKATAGDAGEQLSTAREHTEETLRATRNRLSKLERDVVEQARAADQFVSDNPWRSIGIVAGLAFVVGVVVGRRQ